MNKEIDPLELEHVLYDVKLIGRLLMALGESEEYEMLHYLGARLEDLYGAGMDLIRSEGEKEERLAAARENEPAA
jgi:hypothetical protein